MSLGFLIVSCGASAEPVVAGDATDHTAQLDADVSFEVGNYGTVTTSRTEWEIVYCPKVERDYPERDGFRERHPEWCRKPRPLEEMQQAMEANANKALRKDDHNELLVEELVAGRLYTGPVRKRSRSRPTRMPAAPLSQHTCL